MMQSKLAANVRRVGTVDQVLLSTCILLTILGTTNPLRAQEQTAPIVLVERTDAPAQFVSIDSALHIAFRRDDQPLQVAAEELVRWGTLGELRGRETLLLTDGTLLSGSIVQIDGGGASLEHDVLDPTQIPRDQLRGAVLRRPASSLAFDRLVHRLRHEAFSQDTLLLENGDTLSGTLIIPAAADENAPADERQRTVLVETEGVRIATPLQRIAAIAYRSEAVSHYKPGKLQVGLRDGDLLQIDSLAAAKSSVRMKLSGGLELVTDPDYLWSDVTYLHGNSPRLLDLTRFEVLSYRHLPQLGWETPLGENTNVLGGRLRVEGSLYPTGLGMPGSSRVAFRLKGKYQEFQASIGVDAAAGRRGSVSFRVYTSQGSGPLVEAFQSEVLRGGDLPVPVRVDLREATLLVLLVDQADRGEELDYANWLEARLLK